MEKLFCKKGITISLRCLLIVASLVFGSSAWGQTKTTKTIFSETFDKCDGTGGNDGTWKGISGGSAIDADNTGWTNVIGYGASKCARYGTGSSLGSATTPTLNFIGDATLTFRAGAWKKDKTTLNLSISNGSLSASTVTLVNEAFSEYTIKITGVTDPPTITFKGQTNSDSRFFLDDVVVTQTTSSGGGGKTAATVTFDRESYTVETNGSITVSATKNSTSPIVYSISPADGNVSINAETGKIVVGATAGTYTITATVAENESFTSASATCPLTITAPSFNIAAPTYYKKITTTDELAVGGTYLIVCEGAKYGMTSTAASATYTQGDNNTITNEIAATLGEFELVKTNENYNNEPLYELLVDGSYLCSPNATKTDISMQASESEKTKWLVRFDDDGNVEIDSYCTFSDASKTNRGLIYQNSGTVIKHYAVSNRRESGYLKVQLYQKVTDLAISTLTKGYATFVTDVPYVMPKGARGYAVTVAPQAGVIKKLVAYDEGSQVPAQTALLIGGASGTNYYPAVLKENVVATYNGENYMEGKRNAEGYTDSQKGVAVYYYKLALNSASKLGFYYGATDGAAFQLTKPTTAYLTVPKNITPVNGYLIDFEGETTGIDSIGQTDGNANGAIYNLNGIRMAQPLRNLPKGVYVVNGKKVIRF